MGWRRFRRGLGGAVRANLPAVALFVFVAAVLLASLDNAARSSAEEEKKLAEEGVRRAVVCCYAVEGRYPESYEYLKEHYGLRIDEDKYYVDYQIFASNIMPDITILEVGA